MASQKRLPAFEVARKRSQTNIWLDHAYISESDLDWLNPVESLTLWNVTVPEGFLANLPNLWWLDIRGGSAKNLDVAKNCSKLKYLQVNQVRGMVDLNQIPLLDSLEFIRMYGLPMVSHMPSLNPLFSLRRIELGMLRGLLAFDSVLEAPNLKELLLSKKIQVSSIEIEIMNKHPSLRYFDWFAEDVPNKEWVPVMESVKLETAKTMHPEEWFKKSR